MPLMLYLYGTRFLEPGSSVVIPYAQIAYQLCYILFPVVAGMLIKYKWPGCAKRVVKTLLRPLALSFLIIIIGFGGYVNRRIYALIGTYPIIFPIAAALPWIGFLLSATFAFICRRSRAEILTIAIETGIQNIGIAILVLVYSMPQPEGDMGAIMPLLVSFSTPLPLIVTYIAMLIKEKCCGRKQVLVNDRKSSEGSSDFKRSTTPNEEMFQNV